jgi:hypothetical protein
VPAPMKGSKTKPGTWKVCLSGRRRANRPLAAAVAARPALGVVQVAFGGTLPGPLARYQRWALPLVAVLGLASIGLEIWFGDAGPVPAQWSGGRRRHSNREKGSPSTNVVVHGDWHDQSQHVNTGDLNASNVVVIVSASCSSACPRSR